MKDDPLIIQRLRKTYEPVIKLYSEIKKLDLKKDVNNCTNDMAEVNNTMPGKDATKEEKERYNNLATCQRLLKREADYKAKVNEIKTHTSLVHIYFKQLGMVKYVRDELYGIMDVIGEQLPSFSHFGNFILLFLAACGGIIGLCLGFSLLSLMEFIHFFTLRMFTDMRRERRNAPKK